MTTISRILPLSLALMFFTTLITPTYATDDDRLGPAGSIGIVKSRLAVYAESFPKVQFLHLRGPNDVAALNKLPRLLGEGASNVDYEHDESVRQLLLEVQMDRIAMMLANVLPSATLFRTGKESTFAQPYVCVLTLDERPFLNDPLAATRFMAGIEDSDSSVMPPEPFIENSSFLAFTLDHEVFHCLDARFNGPMFNKTSDKLYASYQRFRAEFVADLYAALAYRRNRVDATSFLNRLASFRTLSILDWDPAHYTALAVDHALRFSADEAQELGLVDLVRTALRLGDQITPSYPSHMRFLANAYHLAVSLGVTEAMSAPEAVDLQQHAADREQMAQLKLDLDAARKDVFKTSGLLNDNGW